MTLPSSSRSAPEASRIPSSRATAASSRSAVVKRPSTTARSAPDGPGWRRRGRRRAGAARSPPWSCRCRFRRSAQSAHGQIRRARADGAERLDAYFGQHSVSTGRAVTSAPAFDRQPEFAHQAVGERRAVQTSPFHRRVAARHLQPATGRYQHFAAAVAEHHGVVPVRLDLDRDDASGLVTIGRANNACALLGTTRMASRSGHNTGPPAENA